MHAVGRRQRGVRLVVRHLEVDLLTELHRGLERRAAAEERDQARVRERRGVPDGHGERATRVHPVDERGGLLLRERDQHVARDEHHGGAPVAEATVR